MSILFAVISPILGSLFLPIFRCTIEELHPEYTFLEFQLTEEAGVKNIRYKVLIDRPLPPLVFARLESKRFSVFGGVNLGNALIPFIIVFTLLLSWPFLPPGNRLKASVIALPLLFILVTIDLSLLIIRVIENDYHTMLLNTVDSTISGRIGNFCVDFFNMGGRQLLAIMIFALATLPFNYRKRKYSLLKKLTTFHPLAEPNSRTSKKHSS